MGKNSLHKTPLFFKFGAVETAPYRGQGLEASKVQSKYKKNSHNYLEKGP